MTAPASLVGMVSDTQYGTLVTDAYEHLPELLYPQSVQVYARMRRDARLTAILDGYGLQLRRAQWQLDGTGCRPEVVQLVSDSLGLNVAGQDAGTGAKLRGVSWNDHLRAALLSQVWGHYGFEMAVDIGDDGKARLSVLAERPPVTVTAIHADPKSGALLGVDQFLTDARQQGPQLKANRLVWYSRNREGAAWQGNSLLRAAFGPWLIKREMITVSGISNRRWAAGVPVAEAVAGTNPSPEQMTAAQRVASAARAGDRAGLAMPPNFVLKIIGLSGSVPDTLGFIRFLNQEMAGSVLMPHLDLGTGESGSRALGTAFIDSWTLALESEGEFIADTITRQCVARLVDWNWGPDELCPKVVVSGVGSRREVTAESLQQLISSGALDADPVLKAWIRREYRLPAPGPDEPQPLPAGPPARLPKQPGTEEDTGTTEEEAPGGGDGVRVAAAAPPANVDVQAMDDAYQQAVTGMTQAWQQQSGPLIAALATAVAAAAAGGALGNLTSVAIPGTATAPLVRLVADGMLSLARQAAEQAAAEVVSIRRVRTTLPTALQARIRATAAAVTDLIVAGYRSAAARVALTQSAAVTSAEQVRQAVSAALADLSMAKESGLVAGNLAGAANVAQGLGRERVFRELPDGVTWVANETLDRNTCGACRRADGTRYRSLDDALADYPTVLGYRACDGRWRCRGFIYADLDDIDPAVAEPTLS
ncbi:phage portal protein family protein [Verrucosispora sp. TAA-831]|uniref:phage portal protein family protein n=1 Tax=Verrucosispora sp. TAA-831 TaxID=3422227 RepID=UPI003D6F549F